MRWMPSRSKVRRLTLVALLCAMALATQYFEALLPPIVPAIPVRLGLANLFTLYALLRLSRLDALAVSLLRCLLFPLLSGAVSGFFYAAAGSLSAFCAMALLLPLYARGTLSPIGLSVAGAFFFNLGQTLVGLLVTGPAMLSYFPYMGLLSIPAGAATGLACLLLIRRLAGRESSASSRS